MPVMHTGNIQSGTGQVTFPPESLAGVSGVTTTSGAVTTGGAGTGPSIIGVNLDSSTGQGVFVNSSGNGTDAITMNFKSIIAGAGIALTSDANSITVSTILDDFNGILGVSEGGTGSVNFPLNSILVGNGLYPLNMITPPVSAGVFLSFDGTNFNWTTPGASSTIAASQVTGLATVATTGSYTDLINTPTIPAAQVNSDWNATSGLAQILNKPVLASVATTGLYSSLIGTPTLATVATSGSYTDLINTPSIPSQTNADWSSASGPSEILNKPTFANVAFSGSYTDLINTPTSGDYQLPVASSTVLGGVMVQSGLTVDSNGNLSANVTSVQGQTGAVSITAANIGAVPTSSLGVANGVATLGINGTIPMSELPPSIVGGLNYQGTWDASTNSPAIATGSASSSNKGWYFKVSVAGTTAVDGNAAWNVGDWIVSDGTDWQQIHNSELVSSVNGATGAVVISANSLGLATVATSGSYTDLINKPVIPTVPTTTSQLTNNSGFITSSSLSSYAPLASPVFTGAPSASTAPAGANTTQLATTAFVTNAISAVTASSVASFNTRTGAITLTSNDVTTALGFTPANATSLSTYAPLASPALTGSPTAPTATAGTNTTQLATTAFVSAAVTASAPNLSTYAPIASPSLTGRATIPATSYDVVNMGSVSGTKTLDLSTATEWILTITGNTTFAFSNVPAAGTSQIVAFRLTNAGAYTITWPTGTTFASGVVPTFTASGVDVIGVKYDTVTSSYMVFVIGLAMAV
jgi:hypothetical protein